MQLIEPFNISSDRSSGQAQPGQVQGALQHGRHPHQDEQHRGGRQGLPEAVDALQTNTRQNLGSQRLRFTRSLSSTFEKIRQVTGFSHTGMTARKHGSIH